MRPRTRRFVALGALLASAAGASVAVAALPSGVILLSGTTSQQLATQFTYGTKGRTINGFRMYFTCRGKRPELDSDLYSIFDGGNDAKPLARAKVDGSVSFDLRGAMSRRSEDGPVPKGSGRLVVRAKISADGSKRVLKGTARVRNARCPSAEMTFRVAGRARR